MKSKGKVILINAEEYVSKKTGVSSAKVLLADMHGSDTATVFCKDLNVLTVPKMTQLDVVFDFIEKFGKLDLIDYSVAK